MQLFNRLVRYAAFATTCLAFSGCSILPYENDYSCRITDNYGKCMSIKQSYDGAAAPDLIPGENHRLATKENASSKKDKAIIGSSRDIYLDGYYNEMAQLIHAPETPLVKPPKTLRTLILSYSGSVQKKTLFMPRFVYSIVDEPEFVLTQFYKTPEQDAGIFIPRSQQ